MESVLRRTAGHVERRFVIRLGVNAGNAGLKRLWVISEKALFIYSCRVCDV